ncbi:hypothetical protein LTV02_04340 [Nocardia yamanashiensis]|uniref:hypothetical protein n=1 Tax=Nocardia yamanashiensis TaxID=209247 RepID=UPI001E438CDA|nr:hypothetical protein [Nocardia yamanashiensis]UGT42654.1 hypothetical protein LTV02_04340 [Nocardia yamanashiensis]
MTVDEIANELYGLPPAEFVAVRTERARQARDAGDKALAAAIGKLRRPTVAAWAVNLLVRTAPSEIHALLELGTALRAAQQRLSGEQLRALTTRRQQVISALTREAAAAAERHGQRLTESTLRDIGATLQAALADSEVGDQLRTGTLTTAASYDGFGPAILVAVPDAGTGRGTGRGDRANPAEDEDGAGESGSGASKAAPPADSGVTSAPEAKPGSATKRRPGTQAGTSVTGSGAATDSVRTAADPGKTAGSGTTAADSGKTAGSGTTAADSGKTAGSGTTAADSGKEPASRKPVADPQAERRRDLEATLAEIESARGELTSAESAHEDAVTELAELDSRLAAMRTELAHTEDRRRFTSAAERATRDTARRARQQLAALERRAEAFRNQLSAR